MVYFFCQFWSTSSVLCQFLSFISVDLLMAFVSFGLLLFFVSFGLILMFLTILVYFFRSSVFGLLLFSVSFSLLLSFFVSFGLLLFFISFTVSCTSVSSGVFRVLRQLWSISVLRQLWSILLLLPSSVLVYLSVSIQFDLQPLPLSNVGLITWSSPRPVFFCMAEWNGF